MMQSKKGVKSNEDVQKSTILRRQYPSAHETVPRPKPGIAKISWVDRPSWHSPYDATQRNDFLSNE
jgi:hypothetical protein